MCFVANLRIALRTGNKHDPPRQIPLERQFPKPIDGSLIARRNRSSMFILAVPQKETTFRRRYTEAKCHNRADFRNLTLLGYV